MTLRLFGTTFATTSPEEVIAAAAAKTARSRLVVTANIDHIITLSENDAFRRAYAGAAARTLDGTPLVWLARLSGAPVVRRITGHDLLAAALALPPGPACRVFLISSCDVVGAGVAAAFVRAGHAAEAVRYVSPPYGFEGDEAYSAGLARAVAGHGTSLLVMGVGAPKSEIWADRRAAEIGAPVVLAVGDALNVAAGLARRPPELVQRLGLEWFFRFLKDPRRLFRRYFVRSWRFLRIVVGSRNANGLERTMSWANADAGWCLAPDGKAE